jgi:hypothetical protein
MMAAYPKHRWTAVVPVTPSSARVSAATAELPRRLRPCLEVGLVQLHDVGAGREQVLGPDRHERRVVLGLRQVLVAGPPQVASADAWRKSAGQTGPVDQPVRLA